MALNELRSRMSQLVQESIDAEPKSAINSLRSSQPCQLDYVTLDEWAKKMQRIFAQITELVESELQELDEGGAT